MLIVFLHHHFRLQNSYHICPNSQSSLPKEDVYSDYCTMCRSEGKSAIAKATFGKHVHTAFPGITCNRLGRRGPYPENSAHFHQVLTIHGLIGCKSLAFSTTGLTKHSYRWLQRIGEGDDSSGVAEVVMRTQPTAPTPLPPETTESRNQQDHGLIHIFSCFSSPLF